ncbi:hypothetical protein JL722_14368 [Aureococcus anophagefferens]|nr:hypothetical protein JL722_14368 [Aureococcus anophagefferens]
MLVLCACYAGGMRLLCACYAPAMRLLCARYAPAMRPPRLCGYAAAMLVYAVAGVCLVVGPRYLPYWIALHGTLVDAAAEG